MKKRYLAPLLTLGLGWASGLAGASANALAATPTPRPGSSPPPASPSPAVAATPVPTPELTPEEMMAKWVAMNAPGSEHERFKRAAGKWRTETRITMPGQAPMLSQGSCDIELVLGGRFLLQRCKGELMGMPNEGIGIEGYDKFRKRYTSVWLDSSGTAILKFGGSCGADGKNCLYYGEMDEPMTGEVGKTVQARTRWIDDDRHVFEMFDTITGDDWTRVVEITYTRVR